ncbi:titin-like isoform X3 [Salarias fasciatus]|uniref:titin-like isoform X3 n=1 Tax=Salarias fasciatus TaxID=181472 RepID=UPI001176E614|nr:titin-like isoform X3 [Salarias fasciatus]
MRLDKVHVLLCWVLLTRLGAEGRGYHVSTERRSWDDARRHCQDCYTDLVIGTPEEIKQGSHPLSESSVYWIGLRKELSSSRNGTMNSSSVPWTHWANRDPLTFQKWFPGWPVPNDTEDSCVAMLNFEFWVEENCSEPLPSICYDVPLPPSDARATAADEDRITFEWTAPENFTRATYGVNISSASWGHSWSATVSNTTRHTFYDLKPDSKYNFEVHAMGFGGNSSSTNCSAYTVPLPPTDARATAADKDRITFEWTAPENFTGATYIVNISSGFWDYRWSAAVSNRTNHTFYDLKSGSKYNFSVHAMGIGGNSSSANCSDYTVTVEREISLSMLCSSATPLLCDQSSTREDVFNRLKAHIEKILGDNVKWSLEKKMINSTGG